MTRHRYRSHAYRQAYDEMEANIFAAHLLVPSPRLREDIAQGIDPIDDEALRQLAARYQVPIYILAIRLHEEHLTLLDEMT